jgi:hypothetical protein
MNTSSHNAQSSTVNNNSASNGNYQIKFIPNENKNENKKPSNKSKGEKNQNINTIIINNNINTYNYNVNINNYSNNNNETTKNENTFLKKRHRFNSFEGIFNMYPELKEYNTTSHFKKGIDEIEYANNFNCTFKNVKNDFDVDNIEEMIMLSQSECSNMNQFVNNDLVNSAMSFMKETETLNNKEHEFIFGDLMLDFDIEKKVNFNFNFEGNEI